MFLYGLVGRFIIICGWVGPLKGLHTDLYQRLLTSLCLCIFKFRTQIVGLYVCVCQNLELEVNSEQVDLSNQVSQELQRVSSPSV